jgi:hypothetical protein
MAKRFTYCTSFTKGRFFYLKGLFLDFSVLYSAMCRKMLGSNPVPGQLRQRHWLSDALTTRLDIIHSRFFSFSVASSITVSSLSTVFQNIPRDIFALWILDALFVSSYLWMNLKAKREIYFPKFPRSLSERKPWEGMLRMREIARSILMVRPLFCCGKSQVYFAGISLWRFSTQAVPPSLSDWLISA